MSAATRQSVVHLPVERVLDNASNIRDSLPGLEELARSIVANGLLEPIVVTEHPKYEGHFLLIAGHRRTAASRLAKMDRIPAIIRHDIGSDQVEHIILMMVENFQRENPSPLERAAAIESLRLRGLTNADIARRTGMHPSTVAHYALVGNLDDETKEAIRDGSLFVKDAIEKVREERKRERAKSGKATLGRPIQVEPPHFGPKHPLATTVKSMCTHSTRRKVGTAGCGQCWEQAIRDDALAAPVLEALPQAS